MIALDVQFALIFAGLALAVFLVCGAFTLSLWSLKDPPPRLAGPTYRPDQLLRAHPDGPDPTGPVIGWEPLTAPQPDPVGAEIDSWGITYEHPTGWLTCRCGPDHTGEDIDIRPDCPVHYEHPTGWLTAITDPRRDQ